MYLGFSVFGISNGFTCNCKEDRGYLLQHYNQYRKGKQMIVEKTPDGKVWYNYLVYPRDNEIFSSFYGRSGAFFGMSLVFDGEYCRDAEGIYKVLDGVYENKLKGQVVQEYPNGNKKMLVDDFGNEQVEKYVGNAVFQALKENGDVLADRAPVEKKPLDTSRCYRVGITEGNKIIDTMMRSSYSRMVLSGNTAPLLRQKPNIMRNNRGRD